MEKIGLNDNLNKLMFAERSAYLKRKQGLPQQICDSQRLMMVGHLRSIRKQADIGLILDAEKRFLLNDQDDYINSPIQASSIANALSELSAASNAYQKVLSPDSYKEVNDNYQSHKSRVGGLPIDEARQFFQSNKNRLLNWDKARLDDSEKSVLEARKENMQAAQTIYIGLQRKALGLDEKMTKEQTLTR